MCHSDPFKTEGLIPPVIEGAIGGHSSEITVGWKVLPCTKSCLLPQGSSDLTTVQCII